MPILATRTLHWTDEAACAATAQRLASAPAVRRATIALHGPLGAGKTTFVRHLLRALGVQGSVKSPTYAVMEPYVLPGPDGGHVAHFDFYRFDDPQEWEDAGFRDVYAGPGMKIAEWPERVGALLPTPDLGITIATVDDGTAVADAPWHDDGGPSAGRVVRLDAWSALGTALLHAA